MSAPPPVPVRISSGKSKSLGVTYVLWFFFGIFGVHQFYLGKAGRGLGYLLTAAWGLVGWFIDLFTLPAQVRRINMFGF